MRFSFPEKRLEQLEIEGPGATRFPTFLGQNGSNSAGFSHFSKRRTSFDQFLCGSGRHGTFFPSKSRGFPSRPSRPDSQATHIHTTAATSTLTFPVAVLSYPSNTHLIVNVIVLTSWPLGIRSRRLPPHCLALAGDSPHARGPLRPKLKPSQQLTLACSARPNRSRRSPTSLWTHHRRLE